MKANETHVDPAAPWVAGATGNFRTNTQAGAPAREGPEAVAVTVPPGAFRTPRAVVAVRCGDLVLRLTVRRLRRGEWVVAPPLAADGLAGVEMPEALWTVAAQTAVAAVRADAEAALALMRRP